MANPSVTYTFTNGTTADGSQVSQNFADLIAGMTDGTKSFSIDALSVAGTAGFSGTVTIGGKAISNPMDSAGDMIIGGASGAITKLDSGTTGMVLMSKGAASPEWVDTITTAKTFSLGVVSDTITAATGAGITFKENDGSSILTISDGGVLSTGTGSGGGHLISADTSAGTVLTVSNINGSSTARSALDVGKAPNDSSSSQIFMRFLINNSGTLNGGICGNGANQATFYATSDRRLKKNIFPLEGSLNKVLALRPVEFDYITGGHQQGFIAQEVQSVFPESVFENADGMLTIAGWDKTAAILVKAIQEQQEQIDALRALINSK